MNRMYSRNRWCRSMLVLIVTIAAIGMSQPGQGVVAAVDQVAFAYPPEFAALGSASGLAPMRMLAGWPGLTGCDSRADLNRSRQETLRQPEDDPKPRVSHARLVFDPDVSLEDQELIGEAIRLAEDFFATRLGVSLGDRVTVTALPIACPRDENRIASTIGDSMVIYTQSIGWLASPPAERIRTVVHEYTHTYQYLKTEATDHVAAAWFEEGVAEYLSMLALSELGLIHRAEIEGLFGEIVSHTDLPPLEELEGLDALQAEPGQVYPLAYFGVAQLLQDRPLSSIGDYYDALQDGKSFPAAFEMAFGLTPQQFYAEFAQFRANELPTMNLFPPELDVSEGTDQASGVTVVHAPAFVIPGSQVLVLADASAGANCTLSLIADGTSIVIGDRDTFADGDGRVFWLLTIPPDLPPGDGDFVLDCGSDRLTLPVLVT